MLCMAVAAVAFTSGFAQTDVTNKVMNPDMEKGVIGWDIDFTSTVWKKQTKNQATYPGYHGFHNLMLECWHGDLTTGVGNSTLSQTLTGLENGTYVFGVYAAAAHTVSDITSPNMDEVYGVTLFANEQEVPMATNPVEGMFVKWGHTSKFNVAVKVIDGTLTFGVKIEDTGVNFVGVDEASLWYFGDMDPEAALDEMAKIDMANVVAIADTCVAHKMNADTLAYLNEAVEAAKKVTKNSELYQADEDLYWAIYLANKSAKEYNTLAGAIASAKEVAAKEWSGEDETVEALEALNALIGECDSLYNKGIAVSAEIPVLVDALAEASAVVELDEIYVGLETYGALVDSIGDLIGDEIGEYTQDMVDEAGNLLYNVELELEMVAEGDISAVEAKANCEKLYAKIQEIIDNPLNYDEFPIFLHRSTELLPGQGTGDNNKAYPVLEGAYVKDYPVGTHPVSGGAYHGGENVITYDSRLFRFRETLTKVRFIVHESGNIKSTDKAGNACFILASFSMYDEFDNEIELTEENLMTNANEPKEGWNVAALIDDNPGSFLHTLWSGSTPQEHYLEVTLPEGQYSAFRFSMSALSRNHSRAFPAEMEITYVSDEITALQQTIVKARELYPVYGTAPGYYDIDLTPFETILAEGDLVVEKSGATDAEIQEAIDNVNAEMEKVKAARVMPDPEKKYRIISSEPTFVNNQNVQKAMTIHLGDSIRPNWLWWEDANADSLYQEFSFELLGEANDKVYYAIKHAATGKYLADWYDEDGVRPLSNAVFTLSETPDSFELHDLSYSEWAIGREGYSGTYMHALNHNSGVADSTLSAQQGIGKGKGFSSSIITWVNAAYDYSGWYFREMVELPNATESLAGLVFRSKSYTLYSKVNSLILTADKECAFENLTVYDSKGAVIEPASVVVSGKKATVDLGTSIALFSFSFDNAEGVETVVVDGSLSAVNNGPSAEFTKLQTAYNAAVAKAPVAGEAVGQVADLSEYDAALAAAQTLLEAEEEADAETLVAAANAVDSAVAHLKINLPIAGKSYYIILGGYDFWSNFGTDMAVYTKQDAAGQDFVYWAYVNVRNSNYLWQFEDCGQLIGGAPAYYLKNVGTGLYMCPTLDRSHRYLVDDTSDTQPYEVKSVNGGMVAIGDNSTVTDGYTYLHPLSHSTGAGTSGNMISWGAGDKASAMRVVEAETYLTEYLNAAGIEDVEIADEYVAPAKKGVYDLFGRRIETPAATGIYIVDGKKRFIKK